MLESGCATTYSLTCSSRRSRVRVQPCQECHSMRIVILFFVTLGLLSGCAQIPKESIQLSATVGRDVAEIERSHRALVRIHYDGLERSINRFVDEVYAPYQIGETLKKPE